MQKGAVVRKFLNLILPFLLAMPVACATLDPTPGFTSVSYSAHDAGGSQGAARSISAEGLVEGSHMRGGGRGRPPSFSFSQETAHPEDMAEIVALARRLYGGAGAPAVPPVGVSFRKLAVSYADGQVRSFYLPDTAKTFEREELQRLLAIVAGYRAGYW